MKKILKGCGTCDTTASKLLKSFVNKKQTIHIMANCECGREWSNDNAKELAMKHADKYGHYIAGELAVRFSYQGKYD